MGRFDAISTIIRLAFDAIGVTPQPWMAVVGVAVGFMLLWPMMQRNGRTKRARKLISGLLEQDLGARQATMDEILELVEGNPEGLVSVADTALKARHRALALRAYERLRVTPKASRKELMRLDEEFFGAPPRHPEQEAAAIERMLEAGAFERAATRCRRARAWFPSDPGLQTLEARITAGRGPG